MDKAQAPVWSAQRGNTPEVPGLSRELEGGIGLTVLAKSADWSPSFVTLSVKERYTKVWNLVGPGGRRYSLVTDASDMGPRSLLVERLPENDAEELWIEAKVPVIYDPRLPGRALKRKWRPLWREWPGLLEGELEVLLVELEKGFDALVGLGPGSTPAGDDFLAGFAIALRWTGFKGQLVDLSKAERKTTWFSHQMLRDAFDGMTWARAKDLLMALSGDDERDVRSALARVLSLGHTSGKAWLSGFGFGLLYVADKAVTRTEGVINEGTGPRQHSKKTSPVMFTRKEEDPSSRPINTKL